MENKDIITLEDGKEYIVLDIIENYFFLSNVKNSQDFCIRKLKTIDEPILIQLKDEKDYQNAIKVLAKKYAK